METDNKNILEQQIEADFYRRKAKELTDRIMVLNEKFSIAVGELCMVVEKLNGLNSK